MLLAQQIPPPLLVTGLSTLVQVFAHLAMEDLTLVVLTQQLLMLAAAPATTS
jgi:hypothetical protein